MKKIKRFVLKDGSNYLSPQEMKQIVGGDGSLEYVSFYCTSDTMLSGKYISCYGDATYSGDKWVKCNFVADPEHGIKAQFQYFDCSGTTGFGFL